MDGQCEACKAPIAVGRFCFYCLADTPEGNPKSPSAEWLAKVEKDVLAVVAKHKEAK